MLWQELTAKNFGVWVEKSRGVCVLPLGVIEKHGDHLPLGTDMYTATEISRKAAELSPAVVFPYYFLGQISEARHYKGTIAASHRLMMDAMLEMCDEIHRNGFTKIIIMNSHGGNNAFLPFFMQEMPRLNRGYAVYSYTVTQFTPEQLAAVREETGVQDMGSHAGFKESAMLMYLKPDLVRMEDAVIPQSEPMGRLDGLKTLGVNTGFHWYSDYPYHFAGDPSKATAELGGKFFGMCCKNAAAVIDAVKADKVSLTLVREFGILGGEPQ